MNFPLDSNLGILTIGDNIIVGGNDDIGMGNNRLFIINKRFGKIADQIWGKERIHEWIVDLCSDNDHNVYILQNLNVAYSDDPFTRIIMTRLSES